MTASLRCAVGVGGENQAGGRVPEVTVLRCWDPEWDPSTRRYGLSMSEAQARELASIDAEPGTTLFWLREAMRGGLPPERVTVDMPLDTAVWAAQHFAHQEDESQAASPAMQLGHSCAYALENLFIPWGEA